MAVFIFFIFKIFNIFGNQGKTEAYILFLYFILFKNAVNYSHYISEEIRATDFPVIYIHYNNNNYCYRSGSTDDDAREAMLLDGGYINGIKMELSLSSKAEKWAIINEVMDRQQQPVNAMWIPTVPLDGLTEKDPRIRKMLYKQQRLAVKRGDRPDNLQKRRRPGDGSIGAEDSSAEYNPQKPMM